MVIVTHDDHTVEPSSKTRWTVRILIFVYIALAIAFAISEPAADGNIANSRGVKLWASLGMAVLMSFASLYLALLSFASLRRMEFPAPGVPVLNHTQRRQGRAAIMPALVCLFGAAGLLALPIMYFWAWAHLQ
jgi:hypothetical protein